MASAQQTEYSEWLKEVTAALESINMSLADWQGIWPFDFQAQHAAGVSPNDAAMKANRFWWHQQNKSLKRECRETPNCWLPRGHRGVCEPVSKPTYERGDYVKVEFPDEATGISEWMWVQVTWSDEEKKLVFGTLDNEPVNDYNGRLELGSELAIDYSQIREHRKPTEFTKQ